MISRKSISLTFLLSMAGTMTLAEDLNVGDVLRCAPTENLPKVEAIVGRLETVGDVLSDNENLKAETANLKLVHLQMRGAGDSDLPEVGHAPFELKSLESCVIDLVARNQPLSEAFEEGYQTWRTAARDGKAGQFTINPADAYWMILDIVDENGALKQ